MATFFYDQLSAHPITQALVKRQGLLGLGRLIRLLEDCTDAGLVGMTVPDWAQAMACPASDLEGLMSELTGLGVLGKQWADPGQGLAMVRLGDGLRFLLARPDPSTVLYTRAAQWAEWMTAELAAPGWLTSDPASQELFRRWCASNATLAEMNRAAELAALVPDISPTGLFNAWKQVRAERVSQAYSRA